MSSTSDKSSTPQSFLSAQTLVIGGIAWGVMALLYFLLFSVPDAATGEKPLWYVIGTYIFECGAFLAASFACLRNWQSPQIVSGRNVWLGIGLGMLSFFVGNLLFGCWELVWALDPDVSLGDFFYMLTYLLLGWGMFLAVFSRRLNLELWQWGTLVAIATAAIALAVWVATPPDQSAETAISPPAAEKTVSAKPATAKPAAKAPAVKPAAKPAAKAPAAKPATKESEESEESKAPGWVVTLTEQLEPFAKIVNLFYIVGDVLLLIIATALLLAFWGGKFSNSWRMIAAATFSLYIADMWFKYATRLQGEYQSGGLLDVFYVFSAVLFGIGAVLEYDISTRSRRPGRKRG